jgi:hypothetical protein
MQALTKIVEIGSRSDRGRTTRHAGMRAGTKRDGTGRGKTSVDKIATGPVGLVDTVVGQWLALGQ